MHLQSFFPALYSGSQTAALVELNQLSYFYLSAGDCTSYIYHDDMNYSLKYMSQFMGCWNLLNLCKVTLKTCMLSYLLGTRGLVFGLRIPALPYFVCTSGKGSDEAARKRRLD